MRGYLTVYILTDNLTGLFTKPGILMQIDGGEDGGGNGER